MAVLILGQCHKLVRDPAKEKLSGESETHIKGATCNSCRLFTTGELSLLTLVEQS